MRIAIAVSFESDGEIEAEIKSYLKMGWFKTGRSFQMIINIILLYPPAAAGPRVDQKTILKLVPPY